MTHSHQSETASVRSQTAYHCTFASCHNALVKSWSQHKYNVHKKHGTTATSIPCIGDECQMCQDRKVLGKRTFRRCSQCAKDIPTTRFNKHPCQLHVTETKAATLTVKSEYNDMCDHDSMNDEPPHDQSLSSMIGEKRSAQQSPEQLQ